MTHARARAERYAAGETPRVWLVALRGEAARIAGAEIRARNAVLRKRAVSSGRRDIDGHPYRAPLPRRRDHSQIPPTTNQPHQPGV
jgi:hypothetical protein